MKTLCANYADNVNEHGSRASSVLDCYSDVKDNVKKFNENMYEEKIAMKFILF